MEKRSIGTSGIEASVFALGCMPLGGGGGWGEVEDQAGIDTVHAAMDLGITIFDTAEGYNDGRSEEILGRALQGRRDKVVIATKVSAPNTAPQTLRAHCEASLKRLRTDHIDLYQVHWPITDYSVADAMATLADLKAEGKIRAIGISNHGVQQMAEVFAADVPLVSNQLHYNLLSRGIEEEIVPICQAHQMDVIAYMPMLQGLLVGLYDDPDQVPPFRTRTRHFRGDRPQSTHGGPGAEDEVFAALARIKSIAGDLGMPMVGLALGWVAAKPFVSTVLVGSRKPAQLQANLAAVKPLSAETVAALDEATEAVRVKLGNNADYWSSDPATSRVR